MTLLRYLRFDASDADEGVVTLEAMASVRPDAQAAVLAEVAQVLQWVSSHFPGDTGPVEDGFAWNHELLVQHEDGAWCTVTLTLAAAPHVAAALMGRFEVDGH